MTAGGGGKQKKEKKERSLSERLDDLVDPTPQEWDPEGGEGGEGGDLTAARVHDTEVDFSHDMFESNGRLRRRADIQGLDHDVYRGKVVSRRDIFGDGHEDSGGDDDQDEYDDDDDDDGSDDDDHDEKGMNDDADLDEDEEKDADQPSSSESVSESSQAGMSDDDGDEDDDDDVQDDDASGLGAQLKILEREKDYIQVHEAASASSDVAKGEAVRTQQSLVDTVLDLRVRLQKAVDAGNRLPQPRSDGTGGASGGGKSGGAFAARALSLKDFAAQNDAVAEAADKAVRSACELINCMVAIRNGLPGPSAGGGAAGVDGTTVGSLDPEDPTAKLWNTLHSANEALFSFADPVLDKWSQRTRIGSGNFKALDQGVLEQINAVLADQPRLLKRCRLKRKRYQIIGRPGVTATVVSGAAGTGSGASGGGDGGIGFRGEADDGLREEDAEIFDDGDFYAQQLRDLVEAGIGSSNPEVASSALFAKQMARMQRKLMKKRVKVDTKASKGRKLSFAVQEKLQNFMFPVQRELPTVTNELFRNLFK